MSEWKKYTVTELVSVLTDYTANGSFEALRVNVKYYDESNYAVLVRTTDLEKSVFRPERYTDRKGYDFQKKTALYGGEIVMANVGSVGNAYKVPYYPAPMTLAPNMFLVKFDADKALDDYMYFWLSSEEFLRQLFASIGSTTLLAVNKGNLRKIKVNVPPLPIQRKIARILSTIDGQIKKTEAIIAKYQAVKQGMLQDLFTRGIDVNTGQLRPRHEDAPELYKESPLGMIPKEWAVEELGDLCLKIVDCKNRTSPFVPISKYPVIRTSNIRNGELVWDDMKYTDEISYRIWTERAIPEADDIIITREAPLGEIMKIPYGITPCLGQRTMLYKLDLTKLLPDFLVSFIMYTPVQSYLNGIAGGSTVKHLKVEEMKEILTFMPEMHEQERIVSLLVSQQKVIIQYQNTLSKLQLLKQGLMQDLLSGKVAVGA